MDVEAAGQPEGERPGTGRGGIAHAEVAGVLVDRDRAHVRGGVGPVPDHPGTGGAGGGLERRGGGIVTVDDSDLGPRAPGDGLGRVRGTRGERGEQAQLGVPVPLERAVQLQVLVREVREDRHVIRDPGHALQLQGVGRGLEDRGLVAGGAHRPQHGLELRGGGRGHVRLVALPHVPHPGLHGADEPGRDAGCLEGRHGQERGRGLAVRPRDPHDAQLPGRIPGPPAGRLGEGHPRALDHDLRDRRPVDSPLNQGRRGPRGRRACHEVVPVHVEPRHRNEQRPGPHPA